MNPSQENYAITATGLSRRFGSLLAVNNINLKIPTGSIYGFLGPNGSGKSTTIRMLCGLLTPSSGTVEVLGLQIPRQAEILKHQIGYMTQKFSLYDDLTVKENLAFVGEIYAIPRKQRKQRVNELLEEFELSSQAKQRAGTLSGGQRQRLALAAAILHKPSLLLLDEPTSAVDPQNRRDFWVTLFSLAEQGTTILVSTHYMDEAERCHRLAILDEGVIVADDTPKNLGENIDMNVYEVITEKANEARIALLKLAEVFSVTQVGLHLRVLMPKSVADSLQKVEAILHRNGLTGTVAEIEPNLEDVFVAVTEKHRKEQRQERTKGKGQEVVS
ncbi:ABC transporter ATP-binding protein [Haliea sp. AH-315-K21]|nr:ABC transporter ATP-binding protein [Haliea sp. AH-315-K21]